MGERKVKRIEYSKRFLRSLGKLSERILNEAGRKEKIFREDPFHPILRVHKLAGKEKEFWAFWVTYSYRIKFIFLNKEKVLFLDIGTHDVYK